MLKISKKTLVVENLDGNELFNGLGKASGERFEIQCAVAFKQAESKIHSNVETFKVKYGKHPTDIPGTTNTGGGSGNIICIGVRGSAAHVYIPAL